MKALTKYIILLFVICICSCAPQTPQETQNQMYNAVWQPTTPSFLSARRGESSSSNRYYGAKDFFKH